jgi:hypothetical protein
MKTKTLGLVIGIAALSIGAAYIAFLRGSSTAQFVIGDPFLPELEPKAQSVDRIEIERTGKRVELVRDGGVWKLATSDSYPARFEEVKGLVSGLTGLKTDQKMTAKKERHGELALAWPDTTGRGAHVRVLAGSDVVTDLILGEERANPRAQFVRRAADDQTWRVLGSVNADIEPRRWVDAELISLPNDEVKRVMMNGLEIGSENNERSRLRYFAVEKSTNVAPTSFEWTPARRETAVRQLPTWLSRLELDDVRKAKPGGVADPAISPEFDMIRGTLKVKAVRDGDAVWISFEAAPKEGAPSADKINERRKYPGDPYIPDWKAFNEKHAGWEYKLPNWKLNPLEEANKVPADKQLTPPSTGNDVDLSIPVQIPPAGK